MTSRSLNTYCDVTQCMNGLWIVITKLESPKGDSQTWSSPPRNNGACVMILYKKYSSRYWHTLASFSKEAVLYPIVLWLNAAITDWSILLTRNTIAFIIKSSNCCTSHAVAELWLTEVWLTTWRFGGWLNWWCYSWLYSVWCMKRNLVWTSSSPKRASTRVRIWMERHKIFGLQAWDVRNQPNEFNGNVNLLVVAHQDACN